MVLTGVMDAQQHLRELRQRGKGFQGLRRHGRDAEHDHASRQPWRRRIELRHAGDEAAVYPGPALDHAIVAHVGQQRPPQRRLPAILRRQRDRATARGAEHVAPVFPIVQPVGAIDLVLVVQIGEPFGKLMALAHAGVVGQEAAQWQEGLVVQLRRQQAQQPPGQPVAIERRSLRQLVAPQHQPIGPPKKARGKLDVDGGGNAAALPLSARVFRQREFEPLGNAIALHQDGFIFQWRKRRPLHPRHRQSAQVFQAIAVDDHETGSKWRRSGHA